MNSLVWLGLPARAADCHRHGGANPAWALTSWSMNRVGSFLLVAVLVCMTGCGRTRFNGSDTGAGGQAAPDGATNSGGTAATGGATSTGGSSSVSDGSAPNELDTCSSDSDCDFCKWETAPASSDQCTLSYCCGGMIATQKRCEANQADWNIYCPDQSPKDLLCPCAVFCPIVCVGGGCDRRCPTPP
jgi:hypothetical protein